MNNIEGLEDLPYNVKLALYCIIRGFEKSKHPIPTIEDLIRCQPISWDKSTFAYLKNRIK